MKLHLGCGHIYKEGWVNVEAPLDELCYRDIKADIYANIEDLNYQDNSIDEILMEAVFEHFPRHIAILQLRKFYGWLTLGGKLTVLVPDFWGTVKLLRKSKSPLYTIILYTITFIQIVLIFNCLILSELSY